MTSTVKHKQRWANGSIHNNIWGLYSTGHHQHLMSYWQWMSNCTTGNVQLHAFLPLDVCMSNSAWHGTLSMPYTLTVYSLIQAYQKVCPVCHKHVLQLVAVQYLPCCCTRQMCRDCDAKLENSGPEHCALHFICGRMRLRGRHWLFWWFLGLRRLVA